MLAAGRTLGNVLLNICLRLKKQINFSEEISKKMAWKVLFWFSWKFYWFFRTMAMCLPKTWKLRKISIWIRFQINTIFWKNLLVLKGLNILKNPGWRLVLDGKGTKLSSETKDKLRLQFSGSKNPFFNKKHSEEFKEWLSSSRKGRGNPMYGKEFSREFL